jgi:chromosome segregation ATPase
LEEILSAALHEKAIAPDGIADFAAGLRDRARLILEDRLRPLQDRIDTLEKENAWRAASIESLTDECRRLKEEMEGVRAEWRTASAAHDQLLGHHRSVMRGTAESLLAVQALPFWKRGQARARLADLAAALRRDTV